MGSSQAVLRISLLVLSQEKIKIMKLIKKRLCVSALLGVQVTPLFSVTLRHTIHVDLSAHVSPANMVMHSVQSSNVQQQKRTTEQSHS